MNKMKTYLCFCSVFVALSTSAKVISSELMTAKDMQEESVSNITITNQTNQFITASGLFIASFDINDCSACYGNVLAGDNAGGALASFVTFPPKQPVAIGQNYLYNMIYNGIYYIRNTVGSSPCLLPGCTWPGDTANTKWCVTINAASPNSSYTYSNYQSGSNPSAKMLAYSAAGNSIPFDYKYDLIDPSTLGSGSACLGPITCDDKNLTCKVNNAQNQSIAAY